MNKIKPLDQNCVIGANALNHTSKVRNKFEIHGNILERLMEFASSVPAFHRSGKGNIRHRLDNIIMLISKIIPTSILHTESTYVQ